MFGMRPAVLTSVLVALCACQGSPPPGPSLKSVADDSLTALLKYFYDGAGRWHECVPDGCATSNIDWGADSMTDALWLRWKTQGDANVADVLTTLNGTSHPWGPCKLPDCTSWSDVPMWDAITAAREHEVTQDDASLARSKAAFSSVDASDAFALGACPGINFQIPQGGGNQLKTLETDSNYLKAALLLHSATQDSMYLDRAIAKYQAIRSYFLDPDAPLYTAYVYDDGTKCTQLPRRFFASVNGNMIWAGLALFDATQTTSYRDDALATAHAVVDHLSDPSGLYANLQVECDVVEPLVEAMHALATDGAQDFAKTWLVTNAQAAAASRSTHGLFPRFFGGPPPEGTVTEWQSNGGVALVFAASALDPTAESAASPWDDATYVANDISTAPSSLMFTGSAISLEGTIGEVCCGEGHVHILVDGTETFDRSGIWQNESETLGSVEKTNLFTWRWPTSGTHTIEFQPGDTNAKEGGSFIHVQGYHLVK
jgi:hypothetical protein